MSRTKTFGLTSVAMFAFAGNSIICRLALRDDEIDAASFTAIRLGSGAIALLLMLYLTRRDTTLRSGGGWQSGLLLFVYAAGFSYAYVSLNAGAGALILFGFVQTTMIVSGLRGGYRPQRNEWLGWITAAGGLLWLLWPENEPQPLSGSLLMAAAGIAWGMYSVRGRSESDALASTATFFVISIVPVAVLLAASYANIDLSVRGVLLAVFSGALTSGMGYVVWYAALSHLNAMQAALVQLSVPVIASIGGIMLLAEPATTRLLLSTALVLGGITLALVAKRA